MFYPRLKTLLICLLLKASSVLAQSKPNIVLFICDDLNQQDVGCYGNVDVRTPHMNALASEGMRFNRAYAASPICTPSRSVMFTGMYPFHNGAQMNHFTVKPNTPNLPQYLHELGYRVVISGKTDVFPLHNFPFERIGEEFGQYAPIETRLDRKKETVHMIESHFKEKGQQPICLIVAPWVPHVPWFPNRRFDPDKLKLPDYLVDTKATRNALASYYQSIEAADSLLGEVMVAIDKAGQKKNTVMLFISDQGAQFPSAKWSVYDQGLRVPLIVRWPGMVKAGEVSDALVSLVDLTPTMVDLGGGKAIDSLDGESFKNVLLGKKNAHHAYIFAETSMEPHFWYNYTPARTVITAEGFHYIRNYHPGVQFITHIDKVERNAYYFDTWVAAAKTNAKAKFLLDRYSYHPPEEVYDLNNDRDEFENLVDTGMRTSALRDLLDKELKRQGETEEMILSGTLPVFFDRSYTIKQYGSAADLSFNKKLWTPEVLVVTAYLGGIDKGGVVCDYFGNFKLYAYEGRIGVVMGDGTDLHSEVLTAKEGQLVCKLSEKGALEIQFDNNVILTAQVKENLMKIKGGYVTCGKVQGEELGGKLQTFEGAITDLRFTMNE
ncbi:sulfatase family protein [Chitinophaga silvisoli]|uniref:Sulfatase n=1 Tax=Chitinophaga silvisoli TaxID=2291814 RepID=A0A3E1NX32_9BACT|nr:sulfatase [Chitinophaga silvisoli]RFM32482.1 sulfatase [Chitinophaga silvisoli]